MVLMCASKRKPTFKRFFFIMRLLETRMKLEQWLDTWAIHWWSYWWRATTVDAVKMLSYCMVFMKKHNSTTWSLARNPGNLHLKSRNPYQNLAWNSDILKSGVKYRNLVRFFFLFFFFGSCEFLDRRFAVDIITTPTFSRWTFGNPCHRFEVRAKK